MVFERREAEVVGFSTPYRVRVTAIGMCKILLAGEKMEEIKLKVFGNSALHTWNDGRRNKRAVKGRCVIR